MGLAVGLAVAIGEAVRLDAELSALHLSLAVMLTVPLLAVAAVVRRDVPRLALGLTLVATLKILAFVSTAWTVLITMHATPLVDAELAAIDRAMGFDAVGWIAWAQQPVFDHAFWLIYHTLTPQTLLVVALYARRHDAAGGWRFAVQMLIAGGVTLIVFSFYPAIGPFATAEAAPTAAQRSYVELFHALHSGEERTVHLFILTGLVTFPSFHAAWAVVLTAAFRPFDKLLPAAVVLNAMVLFTAVTHGCHYLIDILAGVAIGLVAVCAGAAIARLAGQRRRC